MWLSVERPTLFEVIPPIANKSQNMMPLKVQSGSPAQVFSQNKPTCQKKEAQRGHGASSELTLQPLSAPVSKSTAAVRGDLVHHKWASNKACALSSPTAPPLIIALLSWWLSWWIGWEPGERSCWIRKHPVWYRLLHCAASGVLGVGVEQTHTNPLLTHYFQSI